MRNGKMEQEQYDKGGFSLKQRLFQLIKHKKPGETVETATARRNIYYYWNRLKLSKEKVKELSVLFGVYALSLVFSGALFSVS